MDLIGDVVYVKELLNTESQVAEAIKVLRSNLFFLGEDIRVIALTSCVASVGKSETVLRLAAAIAENDKRVLLLDTDMRRSVFHGDLSCGDPAVGLSQYLSQKAKLKEIIYKTDVPNLFLTFAGAKVRTPSELLGGERFSQLIEILRQEFDYIIVDTPPLGQVIDCAIMAPKLDGVVTVIDVTKNSYRMERRIKLQLEKAGGKLLGAVLNRVDFKDRTSFYGRNRKYGCGQVYY